MTACPQHEALRIWHALCVQHPELLNWRFRFNTNKRRHGVCKHSRNEIGLSIYALPLGVDSVRNTIRHEAAHALVGGGHGHGPVWKHKARELGAAPQACTSKALETPPGRWKGVCPDCGEVFYMHRRPKYLKRKHRGCRNWFTMEPNYAVW